MLVDWTVFANSSSDSYTPAMPRNHSIASPCHSLVVSLSIPAAADLACTPVETMWKPPLATLKLSQFVHTAARYSLYASPSWLLCRNSHESHSLSQSMYTTSPEPSNGPLIK